MISSPVPSPIISKWVSLDMLIALRPFLIRFATLSLVVLSAAPHSALASEVPASATVSRAHLSATAAARLTDAAEAEAKRLGVSVSISVIDESGALLREIRMDGASTLLIDFARRKAQTALLFGAPTSVLAADPGMVALIGQVPNLLLVPGGIALRHQRQIIGAIGVSGAAPAVDGQIVEAAFKVLNPQESK
jgi:uncharacterized protein GlcG (DUF336 family)